MHRPRSERLTATTRATRGESLSEFAMLSRALARYEEHRQRRSGAEEGTRTPTVLPPPGPEPGASTNSATSARTMLRTDTLKRYSQNSR